MYLTPRFYISAALNTSIPDDVLLTNPSITAVATTHSNGMANRIIPMIMTDLTGLNSTTIVTTTIKEGVVGEWSAPTRTITVQPSGIWWRDGFFGPPVPIPEFALTVIIAPVECCHGIC